MLKIFYIGFYVPKISTIHISKNNLIERSSVITHAKDSHLLPKFNRVLSKIRDAGFINYFYDPRNFKYRGKAVKSTELHSPNFEKLAIGFCILCSGWISAGLAFMIEISVFKIGIKKICSNIIKRCNRSQLFSNN